MTTERDQDGRFPHRAPDGGDQPIDFKLEPFGFVGPLPRLVRLTNPYGTSFMYGAAYTKIVEPITGEPRLQYKILDRDCDMTPLTLMVRDSAGNLSGYEPLDPRLVKRMRS